MGDGLKKAFAAAAATRQQGTPPRGKELAFLQRLLSYDGVCDRQHAGSAADREEDRGSATLPCDALCLLCVVILAVLLPLIFYAVL